MSKNLEGLIKAVRESKTAAEERQIIQLESALIRTSFKDLNSKNRQTNMEKLLYIHMLGYPSHFGQMECIRLIASNSLSEKRLGYLALMLLLDENQEVLTLVTNSLQHDLNSKVTLYIAYALAAVGNIASPEMSYDLVKDIINLFKHESPYIRKKACLAATRLIRKAPDLTEQFLPCAVSLLSDGNHNTLLTSVTLLITVTEVQPEQTKHLVRLLPSLSRILRKLQVAQPNSDYEVGGVLDPFLQVKLLRLMRILGCHASAPSEELNDVLAFVSSAVSPAKNASTAVLYECVKTVLAVDSEPALRVLAVNTLGSFLKSKDNNIRYIALQSLDALLHKVSRVSTKKSSQGDTSESDSLAVQRHRDMIVECLRDGDQSIRKRALDLVCSLVTKQNARVLVHELLQFLRSSEQDSIKSLCLRICGVARQNAPSHLWHINVLIDVIEAAGVALTSSSSSSSSSSSFILTGSTASSSNSSSFGSQAATECVAPEVLSTLVHLILTATPQEKALATHRLFTMLFIVVSTSSGSSAAVSALSQLEHSQRLVQAAVWVLGEFGESLLVAPPPVPPASNYLINASSVPASSSSAPGTAATAPLTGEALLNVVNRDLNGPIGEARSPADLVLVLQRVLSAFSSTKETRAMVLTAIVKLLAHPHMAERLSDEQKHVLVGLLRRYLRSNQIELQQRSIEYSGLLNTFSDQNSISKIFEPIPAIEEEVLRERVAQATGDSTFVSSGAATAMATVTQEQVASVVGQDFLNDLLGGGHTSTPAASSTKPLGKATTAAILDDLFGSSQPSTLPQSTTTTNTSSSAGIVDLFAAPVPAAPSHTHFPPTSTSTTANISDLFGGISTASAPVPSLPPAVPSTPATAPVSASVDLFGVSSATPPSSSDIIDAYTSTQGSFSLQIRCEKPEPLNPSLSRFTIIITNNSASNSLAKFVCQVALPKTMKLTMEPASADVVPPNASITQSLRVENSLHGQKPMAMRLRIQYALGGSGEVITEQTDVKNFPPNY